ncbi:TetR/AcrR family transcriptional regulator [Kineosporia succinea]|uniref:AcrR family transcriptional regulator n=1 Tax=Kineosporia succinea TaxID=84632 RepID=A0ABT9PAH8_9ACTN|nr:TetR/AcrR family transcriptional regulator [Kineosporia succinea]MDP9829701.1 AcrR family transcriptional regulator [Kineosporia succinea]
MPSADHASEPAVGDAARREAVLQSALQTFGRYGYRKTSMDDIAREARISRPGLYFLFSSKSGLFRAAADRGINDDLDQAAQALATASRSPAERVLAAFDCWAGRYVGPMRDVTAVLEGNPDLLGPAARSGPERFEHLLTAALGEAGITAAQAVAQTLISASIGIKHQVATREEYGTRMATAIGLLVPDPTAG